MSGKRILVTGGSGFIGRQLIERLVRRNDALTVLSRNPASARNKLPGAVRVVAYDPEEEGSWSKELANVDAMVCLAGEPLVGVRWTHAKKKEIESSRVAANRVLVKILQALPDGERPKVLLGASGVGFYGPGTDAEARDETSPQGRGYVADLAARWEGALAPARALGVRVVHLRFGMVLGRAGGALEAIAAPFRRHVGGFVGSGEQMVSWVHIADACGITILAIDRREADGPLNVSAPEAVSMRSLAQTMGDVLERRSYLRVPSVVLRAALGEGAEILLTGQRALPVAAQRLGYEFEYPQLRPALESLLIPR